MWIDIYSKNILVNLYNESRSFCAEAILTSFSNFDAWQQFLEFIGQKHWLPNTIIDYLIT